jgi:hypothetical protein
VDRGVSPGKLGYVSLTSSTSDTCPVGKFLALGGQTGAVIFQEL